MRRKRELAIASEYTVEVLGRRFPVADMVQASAVVDKLRDETGMGAGEMGSQFPVRDGGKIIAFVTFNGRVWAGIPKDYGTDRVHLVYDPSEPAHRAAYKVPPDVTSSRVLRNPVSELFEVVDEEGNVIRRFPLRSDARRLAREHNEDRHPGTMEYFVKTAEMRGCHHLRTSDYARQGEAFPRCGICERPRR